MERKLSFDSTVLSDWLKLTRTRQRQLAQQVGISESALSLILHRKRGVHLALLGRLSQVTQLPIERYLTWR